MYLLAAGDGLPVAWCLATPKLGEREVVAALLDHEHARLRPGLLLVADKGFAGRAFQQLVAGYGAQTGPMNPAGTGRWAPCASGSRAPSTPSKTSSAWNATGGRTLAGVWVRVAQRLLALAACIWWNWQTGQPDKRSLVAYDH